MSTERLRTMSCWRSNAFSATNSAVDLVMSPAAAAASVIAADVGFVTLLTASPATRIQLTTFFFTAATMLANMVFDLPSGCLGRSLRVDRAGVNRLWRRGKRRADAEWRK